MSRRKVKYPTVLAPWRAEFEDLFWPLLVRMGDIRPPERVRVYHGRAHYTFKAVFTEAGGRKTTFTARVGKAAFH